MNHSRRVRSRSTSNFTLTVSIPFHFISFDSACKHCCYCYCCYSSCKFDIMLSSITTALYLTCTIGRERERASASWTLNKTISATSNHIKHHWCGTLRCSCCIKSLEPPSANQLMLIHSHSISLSSYVFHMRFSNHSCWIFSLSFRLPSFKQLHQRTHTHIPFV